MGGLQRPEERGAIRVDRILSNLLLLHDPEEIVEIRSIDPKPTISGLFKANSANIEKQLSRYKGRTFYQTMNRIDPGCYSRAQRETLMPNPRETTSDRDIVGYNWILIDADPVRPSGVSATDREKELAGKTVRAVYLHLKKLGFSEPIAADLQGSGGDREQGNRLPVSESSGYVVLYRSGSD